jgi:CheY-like chemotaxis protein
LTARSILVVDDDMDIRELLTELLRDQGFAVQSAANGQEALSRLADATPAPSLIFLDLMMPVMNGWELVQALQRQAQYRQIPVVLISADRDVMAHAEALGARMYLQKPIELKALLEIAKQYSSPVATVPG